MNAFPAGFTFNTLSAFPDTDDKPVPPFDIGTTGNLAEDNVPDEMFAASMYVKSIQDRTQTMIGCIEGESYKQGFITRDQFIKIKDKMPHCSYKTNLVMSYCFD